MKKKRTLGIFLCIAGLAMIFFSMYIKGETQEGRRRISSAQRQVDTGKRLFSLSPTTEQIGKGITGSAQRRIDEGKREVVEYEQLAQWLQIGGIICIVVGVGVIWTSRKKSM